MRFFNALKMVTSITLDNKLGGIATSLLAYSKALNLREIEHHVILPSDATIIKELSKVPNVTIHKVAKLCLKFHLSTRFIFSARLKNTLSSAKLLLVHNAKIFSAVSKISQKCALINHSGKLRGTNHSLINIFITHAGKQRHESTYPQSIATNYVVNHGFDIAEGTEPLIKIKDNSDLNIISAGRFVKKKGFDDLLKAAKILEEKGIAFCMKIFGDGELKNTLAESIKNLKLQQVQLMGWSSDLKREFLNGDVFCIPSHMEPFGLIMGEAMLAGLPVISTKTDGALDIFGEKDTENRGGILVDIASPDSLAEAIEKLLDREKREWMAKNAYENIKTNFNLRRLADNLHQIIHE